MLKCQIYLKYFLLDSAKKILKSIIKSKMCVKSAKGSCLKPRCLDLWWSLESSFEIFSWTALTLFLFNQCRYYFLKSFHCVRKYFRSLRRLTMHRRLHWNAIWCFRVFLFQILSSLMCKQTVFANNITNRLDSRLITNSAIRTSFVCRRNAKCTSERSATDAIFREDLDFQFDLIRMKLLILFDVLEISNKSRLS